MGKDVSGFIYFDIEVEHPDTTVDVAGAEKPGRQASVSSFPRGIRTARNMLCNTICRAGRNAYEMFHWYGFRYIQLNISGPPGKVLIHAVGTNLFLYPVQPLGPSRAVTLAWASCMTLAGGRSGTACTTGTRIAPAGSSGSGLAMPTWKVMAKFRLVWGYRVSQEIDPPGRPVPAGGRVDRDGHARDSHVHGLIIPDYCFYWMSILYQYYQYTATGPS